jgi:hypothetical protein
MWAVSNSLWAQAMVDARTNVEAIIEAYLRRRTRLNPTVEAYLRRRTRLNPTGIVHRRYSYRQPTSNHSRGQVLVAVPAGKISRSPWPPQNGCRTKPSAIQSMPGCNWRQRLPEAPSSNSCTTADGGLYKSVYYFSAASPVTSFEFSALAFPRPRAVYWVGQDRIHSPHHGRLRCIGYELAKLLGRDRYNLVLVARNRDRLEQFARELQTQFGCSARAVALDLTAPSAPQLLFDQVQRDGVLVDILVNNAGYGISGEFA